MKQSAHRSSFDLRDFRAFSLFELLIVIAVVLILAALLLPRITRDHIRSSRIGCVNNLKQVALGFRIWAGDNNDKYPMEVSITNGGTMEYIGGPETFRHFQVMSNELSTPRILFCPDESDAFRKAATTFGAAPPTSTAVRFSSNTHLSYFLGVDVTETNVSMFLSGDHNLTNGTVVTSGGMMLLTTNQYSGWTADVHHLQGNVALGDGSVHISTSSSLRGLLESTDVATNRLATP